ncbi:MAG: DMT family transporter [Candidatus Dormibacteraeota bacterium]|uniref:DMT family transporter n=1 Tax=Candidatus Dormiibacter inghamiae TaxID=3127013 RepID=A0A934K5Z7_9BACT|nr:DMT family transporter [Candidatus Dormibacteraeota bacterium]MBJ7604929.1 DMT family transporter [Candidatus Dormibacteraeota bacterium]
MKARQQLGYLALIISALLFGVGIAFAVYALRALTPFDLLAVEIGSATATLWLALAFVGPRRTRRWPVYALLGLLEPALSYVLYNVGLSRTSASHGALLESLDGLLVVILGALLLGERLRTAIVFSLAFGLAGAALVGLAAESAGPDPATRFGDALVMLGIVVAAFYSVAVRRFGGKDPALTVTAYQFLAASVVIAPITLTTWLANGSGLPGAAPGQLAAALGSGVVGTAGAYLLFNVGIARVAAGRAALVMNLIPVFGIAAAVIGLHERLHAPEIAGGVLILVSLFALSFAGGVDEPRRSASARIAKTAAVATAEGASESPAAGD